MNAADIARLKESLEIMGTLGRSSALSLLTALEQSQADGAAMTHNCGVYKAGRDAALTELAVLRERLEAAKEALKPFAHISGIVCMKDEAKCGIDFTRRIVKSRREEIITAGDIRRARAAIAEMEK